VEVVVSAAVVDQWEVALGLETGTFVADLVPTNPPSGDLVTQGDDHIRLIKQVLKATFPNASHAFYIPSVATKTANYSVSVADAGTTFYVDTTTGAVTLTLPSLLSTDAGWECFVLKTNTNNNPILIGPATGNILSGGLALLTTRRSIAGIRSRIFWSGSNWYASRAIDVPVGTILDFDGSGLPVGYEWPNGQTLASTALYPDYFLRKSSLVTTDLRGRDSFGKDDMGGTAAGRITVASSGMDGTIMDNVGGEDAHALLLAELASHTHTFTGSALPGHTHTTNAPGNVLYSAPFLGPGAGGAWNYGAFALTLSTDSAGTPAGTNSNTGSSSKHNNMPPFAIMNKLLVVE
jgi:microcystin-dependent protein